MDKPEEGLSFDPDTIRIRFGYRIPTAPLRGRSLELIVHGESVLRGRNWAGEFSVMRLHGSARPEGPDSRLPADPPLCCVGHYAQHLPFGDGSFDVVVLHRTLDELAGLAREEGGAFSVRDFLAEVARILATGGLVVGCVENRYGLEHLLRGARRLLGRARVDSNSLRPLSVPACHRALAAAGFGPVSLFNVLPDPDSPRRWLSIQSGWSRHACKRHAEALRSLVGSSSYMLWRILAELGISQYLGAATVFWGRKGC